jgi:hypothetical protein
MASQLKVQQYAQVAAEALSLKNGDITIKIEDKRVIFALNDSNVITFDLSDGSVSGLKLENSD